MLRSFVKGTVIQKDKPVFMVPINIKTSISQLNLIVEFCAGLFIYWFTIYSSIAKGVPVSVYWLFYFSKNPFFIFTFKKISWFVNKSLCGPLINREYIENIISEFYNILHFIFCLEIIIQISEFQHLAKHITHYIMANIIGWVHKLSRKNRKRFYMNT